MTECPKCNGRGTVGYFHIDHFVDIECDRCHGSGEVSEVDMTNEEWLRNATTDGMTAIFMQFMFDAEFKARFVNGNFITEFRKWLKEIHE